MTGKDRPYSVRATFVPLRAVPEGGCSISKSQIYLQNYPSRYTFFALLMVLCFWFLEINVTNNLYLEGLCSMKIEMEGGPNSFLTNIVVSFLFF